MSHEEIMGRAWRLIHELGISEDPDTAPDYLVKDIHQVRDAFYADIEAGIVTEGESMEEFFSRHGIEWE